jgi:hypothetical protein
MRSATVASDSSSRANHEEKAERPRSPRSMMIALVLGLGLIIYAIHMTSWLVAYLTQDSASKLYGGFSILTLKGDQGYTLDLLRYAAQIRDNVISGPSLYQRDPFTADHAGERLASGNLIYLLAAIPLWFGLPIQAVFFVCPLVSLLLTVWLFTRTAVLANTTSFICRFPEFVVASVCVLLLTSRGSWLNLGNAVPILAGGSFLPRNLGYIGRFPHIEFSIFLLALWFFQLSRALRSSKPRDAVFLGVALAVLQYSYFYWWTSAILFTGLSIAAQARDLRTAGKQLALVLGVYLMLTLHFWLEYAEFTRSAFGAEFALRMGKVKTRRFYLDGPLLVWCAVLTTSDLLYYGVGGEASAARKHARAIWRSTAPQLLLAVSMIALLNIQFIVGFTVQPYHWPSTFYYPVLVFVLIEHAGRWFRRVDALRKPRLRQCLRVGAGVLAAIVVVAALITNVTFGRRWAPYLMFTKSEQELINFVDKALPPGAVIMSNNFNLMAILAANTRCMAYVTEAFAAHASAREQLERLHGGLSAMGYELPAMLGELKKSETSFREYTTSMRTLAHSTSGASATIPDNGIALTYLGHRTYGAGLDRRVTRELEETLVSIDRGNSRKWRLDYLVFYKKYLPEGVRLAMPPQRLFENADFVIAHRPIGPHE